MFTTVVEDMEVGVPIPVSEFIKRIYRYVPAQSSATFIEMKKDLQKMISRRKVSLGYADFKLTRRGPNPVYMKINSAEKSVHPVTGFPEGHPVDIALTEISTCYPVFLEVMDKMSRRINYLSTNQNMASCEVIDCVGNSEELLTKITSFVKEVYGLDMVVVDESKNKLVENAKALLEGLLAAL